MSTDERHVALPRLYNASGAPRRRPSVAHSPRPFDPDDLPIEAEQTDEEREMLHSIPPRAFASGGSAAGDGAEADTSAHAMLATPAVKGRSFGLRSMASRFFRDGGAASG